MEYTFTEYLLICFSYLVKIYVLVAHSIHNMSLPVPDSFPFHRGSRLLQRVVDLRYLQSTFSKSLQRSALYNNHDPYYCLSVPSTTIYTVTPVTIVPRHLLCSNRPSPWSRHPGQTQPPGFKGHMLNSTRLSNCRYKDKYTDISHNLSANTFSFLFFVPFHAMISSTSPRSKRTTGGE